MLRMPHDESEARAWGSGAVGAQPFSFGRRPLGDSLSPNFKSLDATHLECAGRAQRRRRFRWGRACGPVTQAFPAPISLYAARSIK